MKSDFPGWWRCDNCGGAMEEAWKRYRLDGKELCRFCYGLLKTRQDIQHSSVECPKEGA
ncbi:MAG: hypothetical protein JRM83_07025 [Nitrososphaerota archaeon]|nr:hypothetical protein [Nitrososphaerota archaeon]